MTKNKIVLIPFPFDDFSGVKVRPAVCLTNPIGAYRHVVTAFITSQIPITILDTDIVVQTHSPDFPLTGLAVPSVIRLHRLITVPTRIIQSELGALSQHLQIEVADKIVLLFR